MLSTIPRIILKYIEPAVVFGLSITAIFFHTHFLETIVPWNLPAKIDIATYVAHPITRLLVQSYGVALLSISVAQYALFRYATDRAERAVMLAFLIGDLFHLRIFLPPLMHGWKEAGVSPYAYASWAPIPFGIHIVLPIIHILVRAAFIVFTRRENKSVGSSASKKKK